MKKKIIAAAAAAALCVSLAGCQTPNMRMGSAGKGGIYYDLAMEICTFSNVEIQGYLFETKETAGSAANVRLVSQGYLQLAIAQADLVHNMYYGNKVDSNEETYKNFGAIASLYTEACHIVVPADSDIYDVEDLKYKTVSVGESESGTERNAREILEAYGLSKDIVTEKQYSYKNASEKMLAGEIDAMFVTAGAGASVIKELSNDMDIRLLPIDDEHADALEYSYGFYIPCTIKGGTYNGVDEDVPGVGVRSILIVSTSVKADTVEQITRLLYKHKEELSDAVGIEIEPGQTGVTIPLHDGAQLYYDDEEDE